MKGMSPFYKQMFSFLGTLAVIYFATLVELNLFGQLAAMLIALLLASVAVSYHQLKEHVSYRGRTQKLIAYSIILVLPMLLFVLVFMLVVVKR
jgi:hypothetical protein